MASTSFSVSYISVSRKFTTKGRVQNRNYEDDFFLSVISIIDL